MIFLVAETVAERVENEQAINERVNTITSHDIDEEVKRIRQRKGVSNYWILSKNDRVKAKNSIIKRIREEEEINMNLRYLARHRNEQFF